MTYIAVYDRSETFLEDLENYTALLLNKTTTTSTMLSLMFSTPLVYSLGNAKWTKILFKNFIV